MTPKQRALAAFEGRPVDRFPVGMTWMFLYIQEHMEELTGKPAWWAHRWAFLEHEDHVSLYRQVLDKVPLDIVESFPGAAAREVRQRQEFVERDGKVLRHDTVTDDWVVMNEQTVSGYPTDGASGQERHAFTIEDIDRQLPIRPAVQRARHGEYDSHEFIADAYGEDHFIMGLGPPGTLGLCDSLFGQMNMLMALEDEPELVERVAERTALGGIESIRRIAETGIDGIYIYDHMATGEMISPVHYERYCLPPVKAMVDEARALGLKTIVCYYGAVMDRLELLAATGADALQVECSMKGYVNDIDVIAETIGDRISLFANIDPIWCIQRATDADLAYEIRRQAEAGRKARGFVLSPASPITPGTPLARMQLYMDLCHEYGACSA